MKNPSRTISLMIALLGVATLTGCTHLGPKTVAVDRFSSVSSSLSHRLLRYEFFGAAPKRMKLRPNA